MENDMGHGTSRFLKASIAAALLIGMVGAGAVFAATKPSAHAASAAIRRAVRVSAGSAAARKLAHGGSLPAEMVQLTDITAHTKPTRDRPAAPRRQPSPTPSNSMPANRSQRLSKPRHSRASKTTRSKAIR
jgi:hypothetical protein